MVEVNNLNVDSSEENSGKKIGSSKPDLTYKVDLLLLYTKGPNLKAKDLNLAKKINAFRQWPNKPGYITKTYIRNIRIRRHKPNNRIELIKAIEDYYEYVLKTEQNEEAVAILISQIDTLGQEHRFVEAQKVLENRIPGTGTVDQNITLDLLYAKVNILLEQNFPLSIEKLKACFIYFKSQKNQQKVVEVALELAMAEYHRGNHILAEAYYKEIKDISDIDVSKFYYRQFCDVIFTQLGNGDNKNALKRINELYGQAVLLANSEEAERKQVGEYLLKLSLMVKADVLHELGDLQQEYGTYLEFLQLTPPLDVQSIAYLRLAKLEVSQGNFEKYDWKKYCELAIRDARLSKSFDVLVDCFCFMEGMAIRDLDNEIHQLFFREWFEEIQQCKDVDALAKFNSYYAKVAKDYSKRFGTNETEQMSTQNLLTKIQLAQQNEKHVAHVGALLELIELKEKYGDSQGKRDYAMQGLALTEVLCRHSKGRSHHANFLSARGWFFYHSGDIRSAVRCLQESVQIYEQLINIKRQMAIRLSICDFYFELNLFNEAISEARKVIELNRGKHDYTAELGAIIILIKCYQHTNIELAQRFIIDGKELNRQYKLGKERHLSQLESNFK